MNDHTYIFTPTKNYYTIHKEIFSTNLNAGTNIKCRFYIKISSVQSLSRVWLFDRQASLSITNSQSLFKLMSIESVMPSNHLILCRPLLLPPSIFPIIRVFSDESVQVLEVLNGSYRLRAKHWQRWTPLKLLGIISPLSFPAFRDCLSSLVPGLLPAISAPVTFTFVITSPSLILTLLPSSRVDPRDYVGSLR